MPEVLHVWLPVPVPGLDYLPPHDPAPRATGTTAPDAVGEGDRATDSPATARAGVGRRVAVPWQGGLRVGWVAGARQASAAEALDLRPAIAWIAGGPALGAPVRTMLSAQAARCAVPIGVSVAAFAAAGLKGAWIHLVRRDPAAPVDLFGAEGRRLADAGWHDASAFDAELLDTWRRHGLLRERVEEAQASDRRLVALRPADDTLAGAAREGQRRALAWLVDQGPCESAAALARDAGVPPGAARALVAKGFAGYLEVTRPPASVPWVTAAPAAPFDLDPPPAAGAAAGGGDGATAAASGVLISGGDARARWRTTLPWLLGAVAAGRQALLLVPEQAQAETLSRAAAQAVPTLRWGADLADDQRAAVAGELAAGTPALLVGTYPALALDLPGLARVAVWDAASGSHKQLAGARSVGRRDALELARAAGAAWALVDPLATAELRAAGAEREVALPRPRPRAALLDLRHETGWPLCAPLVRLLRQVAERRRQALLVVPRRGYAAALGCRSCGEVVMCPHCDLPLRWHARIERLRCHHCGYDSAAPDACPACGAPDLAPRPGAGTEWVAEAVHGVAPTLCVLRWDHDQRDDPAPLLAGEAGVVVGTTAALRLPPLPDLALVALTAGDALHDHEDVRAEERSLRVLLSLPDLASSERRPLLVAQVHRPEHEVWRTWLAEDLDGAVDAFIERVMARRRALGYPPARHWARVQLTHRDRAAAASAAHALAGRLLAAGVPEDDVLGPAPAPLARARGRYAFHVLVRADDEATLAARLAHVDARPGGGVRALVDVDPYDIETWLD
ncbi:MAG: hypothetical protein K0A98_00335 [Trueperaceae bacterium]|nr:hypothetical protein [Trueperaceae bacterium]